MLYRVIARVHTWVSVDKEDILTTSTTALASGHELYVNATFEGPLLLSLIHEITSRSLRHFSLYSFVFGNELKVTAIEVNYYIASE